MTNERIIYLDMPENIKGFVIKTFDEGEDYYSIVINPKFNWEQQEQTYRHELKHIEHDDLADYCDPNVIERLRHA